MRHILPADVIDRHSRAVHDYPLDIVRAERMPRLHRVDRVECRVIAADARVELQRNAHRLEALAQAVDELRQIEAIGRTRKCAAKAAIRILEHVDDAGEAVLCEQRAVKAALRRTPRVHALDHGAELRSHQARRLRAADSQRVHRLFGVEPQRGRSAGGRRKHADRRA